MKHHHFNTIRQGLAALALFMLTCLSAHAAPYFTNESGDQVWDKATGLVWMRCSLGQTWDGKTCAGEAKQFSFGGAQAAARTHPGWVVPSVAQLVSLRVCSAGESNGLQSVQGQGGGTFQKECAKGSSKPAINMTVFPKTLTDNFWSSSPYVGFLGDRGAWVVNFRDGDVKGNVFYNGFDVKNLVRLVRASSLLDSEAALAEGFNTDLQSQIEADEIAAAQKAEADRIAAAKKAEADRIAAAQKAEAERLATIEREKAERKAKADRAAALQRLVASGAQSLYLEAGKAQRNGSVTHNGQSFYASELYELVIEKFPSSPFAVKASDQLSAAKRQWDAESTRRTEDARSKLQCSARINSCNNSCGASYECTQRCRSICSE